MRKAAVWLVVPLAAFGVSCGGNEADPSGDPSGQVEGDGQIAQGQELYESNCAQCHGQDLTGTDDGPPFLHPVYASDHHPDESFFAAVEHGVRPHHWEFGPMPPIGGLSENDVAAIVSYVRTVQETEGLGEG